MKSVKSTSGAVKVLLILATNSIFQMGDLLVAQELDSIPGVTLGLLYESEFHPAIHSYFMRNIIPKGSWAQNSPGTSRSAAFCIGAL